MAKASVVLIAVLLGACRNDVLPSKIVVRDSADIRIVVSDLSDEAAWPSCLSDATPVQHIRSSEHDDSPLYLIEDAHRRTDGTVLVINRSSAEIRMYEDSILTARIGRQGEGPGEFTAPAAILPLRADSFAVLDLGLRRISTFSPDGGLERIISLQTGGSPTGRVRQFAGDSGFLLAIWDPQWPREFEVVPQRLNVIRFDSAGNPTDTIATLPFGTQRRLPADVPAVWRGLFEPQGVFTVSGTRLYATDAEVPEVRVWSDDQLIEIIRWHPSDRSVRPGDADAGRRELEEDFPPALRDQLRPGFATLSAPAMYPAVSDIHAGPAGELWVRRYPSPTIDGDTWWSFGIDGGFRCAFTVPKGSKVFEFGAEHAVVKGTTDLGEEYVDVIAIRP